MASQIEQLRIHFKGLNTTQKKVFINNLKQKLQSSKNVEYMTFLNDCVKAYNEEVKKGSKNTFESTHKTVQTMQPAKTTATPKKSINRIDDMAKKATDTLEGIKEEINSSETVGKLKDNFKSFISSSTATIDKTVKNETTTLKPIYKALILSFVIPLGVLIVLMILGEFIDIFFIFPLFAAMLIIICPLFVLLEMSNQSYEKAIQDRDFKRLDNVAKNRTYVMGLIGNKKYYTVTNITKFGEIVPMYLWRDDNVLNAFPLNELGLPAEMIEKVRRGILIGFNNSGGVTDLKHISRCCIEGTVTTDFTLTGGETFSKTGAVVGGLIAGSTGAIIGGLATAESPTLQSSTNDNRRVVIYHNGGYKPSYFALSDYHAFLELIPEKCK